MLHYTFKTPGFQWLWQRQGDEWRLMAISGQEWGITHSTQCQDPLFKWYMEKTNAQLGKQQVNAIFISNPFSCHFVIAKKKWELARAVRNGSAPSRAEQAAMVSSKSSSNTKLSFPTATCRQRGGGGRAAKCKHHSQFRAGTFKGGCNPT